MENETEAKESFLKIRKSKTGDSLNNASYDMVINTAIWREKPVNGEIVERKLSVYDNEHLNSFYNLCYSMLYSNDKHNPGKVVMLADINKQIESCNVTLFIRWIKSKLGKSEYTLNKMFEDFVNKHINEHPNIKSYQMKDLMGNCPDEFSSITISQVMNGCVEALGAFNKRKITKSFLYRIGVYISDEDNKSLVPTKEERSVIANYYNLKNIPYKVSKRGLPIVSKCDVMKLRLGVKLNEDLRFNMKGLSFSEFKAAISLNNCERYTNMTQEQLLVLRNRLLPMIKATLTKQIESWKKRMRNIEVVAQSKGYLLTTPTGKTVGR